MHRIDDDGNVGGLFSDGDPLVPTLPTNLTAAWLNDQQESQIAILTEQGITPVKGLYTQVRDAIGLKITAAFTAFLAAVHTWTARQTLSAGAHATGSAASGATTPVVGVTNAQAANYAIISSTAGAAGIFVGDGAAVLGYSFSANGYALAGVASGGTGGSYSAGVYGTGDAAGHNYGGQFSTLNPFDPLLAPTRSALRIVPSPAPANGEIGDLYMTTAGVLKVCTVAGAPGTWVSVGAQV